MRITWKKPRSTSNVVSFNCGLLLKAIFHSFTMVQPLIVVVITFMAKGKPLHSSTICCKSCRRCWFQKATLLNNNTQASSWVRGCINRDFFVPVFSITWLIENMNLLPLPSPHAIEWAPHVIKNQNKILGPKIFNLQQYYLFPEQGCLF